MNLLRFSYMTSTASSVPEPSIRARLRVVCGNRDAFGPGKAQLLEELSRTGSLNKASKALNMSYMKAWTLVKAMNEHFVEPLVSLSRGGIKGGGAELTETGQEVLRAYHQMRREVEAAAEGDQWRTIKSLLRPLATPTEGLA